jgi:hypothetical protein
MNVTVLLAFIVACVVVFIVQRAIVRSLARKGERSPAETTR